MVLEETQMADLKLAYEDLSLAELASEVKLLRERLDAAAKEKTDIQKLYDFLTISIVPDRMDDEGVENVKIKGVGRLQVKTDIRCSCPVGNKEALHSWLAENNHGALIKPLVSAPTLKAFVKEQLKQGGNYPDSLLKIEPYSRATVVKT